MNRTESTTPPEGGGTPSPRSRWRVPLHLLFWTALFYLLTWGVAVLCERLAY